MRVILSRGLKCFGAHHVITLATAKGLLTILTISSPPPLPHAQGLVPSTRLTPLTVSPERASNSVVSIWLGRDRPVESRRFIGQEIIPPCYESAQ